MKKYTAEVNGVTTTLLLNDADAEARGLKKPAPAKAAAKEAPVPANKGGRKPSNKQAEAAAQAFGAKNSG